MIANLCLSNKPVTFFHVLCDVLVGSGLQRVENLVSQGSCCTSSSQIKNFARFLIWLFDLLWRYLSRTAFFCTGTIYGVM